MRILSQDGLIFNDIPYEKFVFGRARDRGTDKFCIVANKESTVSESGYPLNGIMAEYSTEAKARKAMEMLRGAHISHTQFKIMTEVQRSVFLSSISEKEQVSLYGLFQFPTDDEVEV